MTSTSILRILIILFLLILLHIVYSIGFHPIEPYIEHLSLLLMVEICVESILLIIVSLISYRIFYTKKKSKKLRKLIEWISIHLQKKKFDKIFEDEIQKEYQYQEELVKNALINVNSINISKKKVGIQQLYYLGNDGNLTIIKGIYISLIHILENEIDENCRKIVVKAICHFHKKIYQEL